MAFQKTQGMNKEKLVFYLCFVLLAVSAYLYCFGPRTRELVPDAPITNKPKPETFDSKSPAAQVATALPPERERKSPFTYDSYQVGQGKTTANPKEVKAPPPPPPPPPQPAPQPKTKTPMTPTAKDLQVSFMGVVQIEGKAYALLSSKDGAPPRRVKEGDVIDGLNYTIAKIEKQAVHVKDEEGQVYLLKDGRFENVAQSNGGTQPSFTDPNKPPSVPKNQPAPQQRNNRKGG